MFDSLISHLFSITITPINFTFSYHYDLAFKIPKLSPSGDFKDRLSILRMSMTFRQQCSRLSFVIVTATLAPGAV